MYLHVKIKPASKLNSVIKADDGSLIIKIKAPAQDGKANEELIRFLSEKLKLPKSSIQILSGATAPFKKLQIYADENEVMGKLLS